VALRSDSVASGRRSFCPFLVDDPFFNKKGVTWAHTPNITTVTRGRRRGKHRVSKSSKYNDAGWNDCFAESKWQQFRAADGAHLRLARRCAGERPAPIAAASAAPPESPLRPALLATGWATASAGDETISTAWPSIGDVTHWSNQPARRTPHHAAAVAAAASFDDIFPVASEPHGIGGAADSLNKGGADSPCSDDTKLGVRLDDVYPPGGRTQHFGEGGGTRLGTLDGLPECANHGGLQTDVSEAAVDGATADGTGSLGQLPQPRLDNRTLRVVERQAAAVEVPQRPQRPLSQATPSEAPRVRLSIRERESDIGDDASGDDLDRWIRDLRSERLKHDRRARAHKSKCFDDPDGCAICFGEWGQKGGHKHSPANDVFVACGHGSLLCHACARRLLICPFCRAPKDVEEFPPLQA